MYLDVEVLLGAMVQYRLRGWLRDSDSMSGHNGRSLPTQASDTHVHNERLKDRAPLVTSASKPEFVETGPTMDPYVMLARIQRRYFTPKPEHQTYSLPLTRGST